MGTVRWCLVLVLAVGMLLGGGSYALCGCGRSDAGWRADVCQIGAGAGKCRDRLDRNPQADA